MRSGTRPLVSYRLHAPRLVPIFSPCTSPRCTSPLASLLTSPFASPLTPLLKSRRHLHPSQSPPQEGEPTQEEKLEAEFLALEEKFMEEMGLNPPDPAPAAEE